MSMLIWVFDKKKSTEKNMIDVLYMYSMYRDMLSLSMTPSCISLERGCISFDSRYDFKSQSQSQKSVKRHRHKD